MPIPSVICNSRCKIISCVSFVWNRTKKNIRKFKHISMIFDTMSTAKIIIMEYGQVNFNYSKVFLYLIMVFIWFDCNSNYTAICTKFRCHSCQVRVTHAINTYTHRVFFFCFARVCVRSCFLFFCLFRREFHGLQSFKSLFLICHYLIKASFALSVITQQNQHEIEQIYYFMFLFLFIIIARIVFNFRMWFLNKTN